MLLKRDAIFLYLMTVTVFFLNACATKNETIRDSSPADSINTSLIPDMASVISFDSTAFYLQSFVTEEIQDEGASSEAVRSGLNKFYDKRVFEPAWLEGLSLSDHAVVLIKDICSANEAALLPVSYNPGLLIDVLNNAAEAPSHITLAALDLQLSRAFLLLADDHFSGRIDPEVLPYEVFLERRIVTLDSVMEESLSRPAPASFSASLQPNHFHYRRLLDALNHYRDLEERGGWPMIESNEVLEPGIKDSTVSILRRRLLISGDLIHTPGEEHNALYDVNVATAVARFQTRHGLLVDSLVGPSTIEALNVSVEDRIRQIERSIERWRWLPQDLSDRYVLVNIPAFKVYGFDEGAQALEMRVIVGSEYNEQYTPVFSDRMDYVVFRPYWNVPHSIASEEIGPKALSDSTFITRNGYEILAGERIVTPDAEAIEKLIAGQYRIRQQPGPRNALGLVKFIFPNRHAIYLHDTPADHLFERHERDLSHGCIRLEDPPRFASYVLGKQGWNAESIQGAIYSGDRQEVSLDDPIPVYLMYLTTSVDEDGTVFFYDDVYGFDAELAKMLAKRKSRLLATASDTRLVCRALQHFHALN